MPSVSIEKSSANFNPIFFHQIRIVQDTKRIGRFYFSFQIAKCYACYCISKTKSSSSKPLAMDRNVTAVRRCYFFVFSSLLLLLFSPTLFAQQTIRGRITDSTSNTGLPRVTVAVKGTNRATATDGNGNFSISASRGNVLLISAVGYLTNEVPVGDDPIINIPMQSRNSSLNEVVVIGYGTRQKKDVTGAVSTVGTKEIERSTAMTPELALQGQAAGVFISSGGGAPGSRPNIRIRGVNTMGFAEPLYVVDGVPIYEGGAGTTDGATGDNRGSVNIFTLINPADIESISVLKDASAAAIYGVRASNGVILITTKKGRTGKPRVEFTASYGVQNLPKTIPVLNTQQYFGLLREAYANNPEFVGGVLRPFGDRFGSRYNETNTEYMGNAPTYDWQKELINKNAMISDFNTRVSGGSEGFTYYFSGGYTKQESPLKGNNLKRYSIATNIESRISKYFSAGLTLRLVQQDALDNTSGSLTDMMSTIPFQPIYDPNGPYGFAPTGVGSVVRSRAYDSLLALGRLDPGAPYILQNSRLLWGEQSRYNAFALMALNKRTYNQLNALGNAYLQVEPIAGLRIRGVLGGNYFLNFREEFQNNDAWQFRQPLGAPFGNTMNDLAKGSLGKRNTRTTNLNKELIVNYNKTINADHNIDVLLSASDQFARWDIIDLSGQVNYVDPLYWGIANRPPNVNGFQGILQEDALIGYLGRISYKFQDKYYFDATVRRDGSSRLAPGNKWDNFPSFAAAWRISKEAFFPKTGVISDLKLRGGWGKLGNFQSAGYYKFLTTVLSSPDYSFGAGNGNSVGSVQLGAALPGFANTDLTWEKVKTINIGFDAVLFRNLTFTAEYYDKTTSDIIQTVSLPPNTGIQDAADLNVASVKNSGFEFQLGYSKRFGDVNLNLNGNLTTVKNRVLKLNQGNPIGGEGGRVEEGYSMFYLWGHKVGGIFQNQAEIDAWRQKYADGSLGQSRTNLASGYQYKPGDMYFVDVYGDPRSGTKERYSPTPDGVINSNDRTYLGKTIPGYYYGFSLSADYKGLDLSVLFQGVGDVQRYNGIRSGLESMGGMANQWATTLERWTPTNPSTTMPRAVFGNPAGATRFSSRFVEDAGYLRLKNIQLGYSLPRAVLGNLGFVQNFRLYVAGLNLFTVTDYTGLDPENDVLPPTKQILFGMNVTF
jgi:TonB-linked SusC/RagA family outer membrane protein